MGSKSEILQRESLLFVPAPSDPVISTARYKWGENSKKSFGKVESAVLDIIMVHKSFDSV